MPSPLLHLSSGAALGLLGHHGTGRRWWHLPALLAGVAVLPDLDILPGLLLGEPNRFHAGVSHSVGAAAVAAGVVWLLFRADRHRLALWTFAAWTLSAGLDTLNVDSRPPKGVPLLWPFTDRALHSPVPIFPGIRHASDGATLAEFFGELASMENLVTLGIELGVGAGLIAAALGLRRLLRPDPTASGDDPRPAGTRLGGGDPSA